MNLQKLLAASDRTLVSPARGLVLLLAAIVGLSAANAQASIQYQFRGQVIPGSSNNPQVQSLETWVATFLIDETVPASLSPHAFSSLYAGAVISGSLVFSGGYTSLLDFAGYDVYVFNDKPSGDGPVDAVYITGLNPSIGFQAVSNLDPLSSESLPLPVSGILPNPATTIAGYVQLSYTDGNGTISYTAHDLNNVAFVAGAVPEPISAFVWTLLGMSLLVMRKQR